MVSLYGEIKQCLFCWLLSQKGHRLSRKIPNEKMTQPIDFVVTWVDGSDPVWRAEKEKYEKEAGLFRNNKNNGEERYRDWDLFRYWFRAVEKYAPWVRHVYLVTEGHVPEWLNLECPKLKHIRHRDYIPEEYLPTFNSNVIELNLHRIEGLSEYFVNFNDDTYLSRPCEPEDFFHGGKPNYTAIAYPLQNRDNGSFSHSNFAVLGAINNAFEKQPGEIMKEHPELWFHESYGYEEIYNMHSIKLEYMLGMFFSHLPTAFRKSTFRKVWDKFPEMLMETSGHRFRTPQDLMHQLVSFWDIMNGSFYPVSIEHHGMGIFRPMDRLECIVEMIHSKKYLSICINDSENITYENFLMLKAFVAEEMEKAFPEKSSFEK